MKISKSILATLFLGLLTLNGCMMKHIFSNDESNMSMHEGMSMEGMPISEDMPMHNMHHSNDE